MSSCGGNINQNLTCKTLHIICQIIVSTLYPCFSTNRKNHTSNFEQTQEINYLFALHYKLAARVDKK